VNAKHPVSGDMWHDMAEVPMHCRLKATLRLTIQDQSLQENDFMIETAHLLQCGAPPHPAKIINTMKLLYCVTKS
jgi:hypothetical protein